MRAPALYLSVMISFSLLATIKPKGGHQETQGQSQQSLKAPASMLGTAATQRKMGCDAHQAEESAPCNPSYQWTPHSA